MVLSVSSLPVAVALALDTGVHIVLVSKRPNRCLVDGLLLLCHPFHLAALRRRVFLMFLFLHHLSLLRKSVLHTSAFSMLLCLLVILLSNTHLFHLLSIARCLLLCLPNQSWLHDRSVFQCPLCVGWISLCLCLLNLLWMRSLSVVFVRSLLLLNLILLGLLFFRRMVVELVTT